MFLPTYSDYKTRSARTAIGATSIRVLFKQINRWAVVFTFSCLKNRDLLLSRTLASCPDREVGEKIPELSKLFE